MVTSDDALHAITHRAIDLESRNHFHRVAIPNQSDTCRDDAVALLHSLGHGNRVAVCFAQFHIANSCDLASALLYHHENGIAVWVGRGFHDRIQRHDRLRLHSLRPSYSERDDHAWSEQAFRIRDCDLDIKDPALGIGGGKYRSDLPVEFRAGHGFSLNTQPTSQFHFRHCDIGNAESRLD